MECCWNSYWQENDNFLFASQFSKAKLAEKSGRRIAIDWVARFWSHISGASDSICRERLGYLSLIRFSSFTDATKSLCCRMWVQKILDKDKVNQRGEKLRLGFSRHQFCVWKLRLHIILENLKVWLKRKGKDSFFLTHFQGTIVKQGQYHEVSSIVKSPAIIEENEGVRAEKRRQSEMRRISRSVVPQ